MKAFIVLFSVAAMAAAAPSGHGIGAVISGPSGIVTGAGAIGPAGHGSWAGDGGWGNDGGWGGHGGWGGPVAVSSWGGLGHGVGLAGLGHGVGLGGWGGAGLGWGGHGAVLAAPVAVAAPVLDLGLGHHGGVAAITNGGGHISATGHGAIVKGPPTAPVVVAGPSGKIQADGLWGPTANIGLTHGHGGHGW